MTVKPVAPAVPAAKKSGTMVTVACKHPNGLILQLQRKETYQEQTMTGARDAIRFVPYGRRYIVAGPGYPVMPPKGYPRQVPVAGGFGLTKGIPAEFWDEWVKQNHLNPVVTSGAIFAATAMDDVEAQAEEFAKLKTGFEPLEVTTEKVIDYRMPKPANPNVFYTMKEAEAANPQ